MFFLFMNPSNHYLKWLAFIRNQALLRLAYFYDDFVCFLITELRSFILLRYQFLHMILL